MRTVVETWYISEDGCRFSAVGACQAHEELYRRVQAVMSVLPPRPSGMDQATYYPHGDLESVRQVKLAILHMAQEYPQNCSVVAEAIKSIVERCRPGDPEGTWVHPSWATMAIGDTCPSLLRDAWERLATIDGEGREWDQMYYVDHADRGAGPCMTDLEMLAWEGKQAEVQV